MLNYKLFAENITGLAEVFNTEMTDSKLKIYYLALQGLTDNQFIQAVEGVIKTHVYNTMPKPAEFLELFREDKDSKATESLLQLENAIRKYGYYDSVQFDDPVIHKTVEALGGWQNICTQEDDQWIWTKKEFIKIYNVLEKRGITSDCPNRLIGFFEQDNTNRGTMDKLLEHLKPKTVLIEETQVKKIEGHEKV